MDPLLEECRLTLGGFCIQHPLGVLVRRHLEISIMS